MRFLLDLTTVACGDMHGASRHEQQLARYALGHRPDVGFTVFDSAASCFRAVDRDLTSGLIEGAETLKPRPKKRRLARLFGRRSAGLAHLDRVTLDAETVVISVGMDWETRPPGTLRQLKRSTGLKYCGTCYDLIGVLQPHFMPPGYKPRFEAHFNELFANCELVMVYSAHVAAQVRAHTASRGMPEPALRLVPIGADSLISLPGPAHALPMGLQRDRFILCVAGISPRKNHRLLYLAWAHMVARDAFDPGDMKVVLVGPARWLSGDLCAEIALNPATRNSFVRLDRVDDALLKELYLSAAFCAVPSFDEGYGLQVAEGLAAGKLVLATDQGATPELFGKHCILLNPYDVVDWARWIRRLVENPAFLAERRSALVAGHRPTTGAEASAAFFEAVTDYYLQAIACNPA